MSQLEKIESGGSIKVCQWRHGGAGGAWRVAFSASSSHNCCCSPKDALTCLVSSLVLSSPGTVDSSIHQLEVSHFAAFHWTHSVKSRTVGSGGISPPSLSDFSGDPHRKEATVGANSGSSIKSDISAFQLFVVWWHLRVSGLANLAASSLPPSFSRPPVILASWSHPRPQTGSHLAEPFNFFFQSNHSRQHPLVHFVHPGKTSVYWAFSFPVGISAPGWMGISRTRLSSGLKSLFPSLQPVWDSSQHLFQNCQFSWRRTRQPNGVYTPRGRSLIVLPCWSLALPAWWGTPTSGLSWGICCNGTSGWFVLPLSVLLRQHGRTFCAILLGSVDCPWPNCSEFPGTNPCPWPFLICIWVSTLQQISGWLLETFPTVAVFRYHQLVITTGE